jgi:hypothetical protein
MLHKQDPNQNHLLAALLDAEFDRLAPHLEPVSLLLGDVLCESGDKLDHVYHLDPLPARERRLVGNRGRRQ